MIHTSTSLYGSVVLRGDLFLMSFLRSTSSVLYLCYFLELIDVQLARNVCEFTIFLRGVNMRTSADCHVWRRSEDGYVVTLLHTTLLP